MDLSFLRPLYARPGPWASVYLDASRDTEDAAEALELRWRALAAQLGDRGADPATITALGSSVLRHVPRSGEYGLALSAANGEVVLHDYLPAPPRRDLAAVGPLPHAMPLVAHRGEEISWIRVLVSRTGAEIDAVSAGGLPRQMGVDGSATQPIRKVKPGAWSQARFQRAAELTWHRNAGESAAATAALAEQVGAEILVVAGDPQARQLLIGRLPRHWQSRTVQADVGSRAVGADPEPLTEATIQAIAEVAARHTDQALDRYGSQRGRGDGLPAVIGALQRAQVDTMLLVDDPSSTQRVWIGPEPTQIALDPAQLTAMSVAEPREVRADAALLRALAATDADLVLVGQEAELDGGVGAVLRYADPVTG
ncbi:baeRF2 domain-containing protein [Micromonospora sp. NBC_01813]|uniref:baeRF2 domain-containing protein n=1 Tax=Micromonospora sp. NBC_01813 TaxID=2975988 RepID=UPI002DD98D73|nr:Vms1/Ankzf1 family peptidyl-tRNA hydrolase [Micromonospora sp. NBC_01813]WSA10621.1 Vms1/Ankzf1 family peptidyl-tRNA hydrolase [Micromonospora sp. NBC_01813]